MWDTVCTKLSRGGEGREDAGSNSSRAEQVRPNRLRLRAVFIPYYLHSRADVGGNLPSSGYSPFIEHIGVPIMQKEKRSKLAQEGGEDRMSGTARVLILIAV